MVVSEFRRNVLTLISGTVVAQAIPVLLQPLLRRLFTPEQFGVYALYLSVVGILSIVSSLKYEMAIVQPKEDNDAVKLFLGAFLINLSSSVLFFLALFIFKSGLASLLHLENEYAFILLLVPLSIFLLSTGYSANFLLVRKKKFKASSINKVSRRFGEGVIHSSAGILKINLGLIWGDLIGHATNIIVTVFQLKKSGYTEWNFSLLEIKKLLIRYIHFPKFNAFPSLLNSVSLLFPVILISNRYSSEITGQFDLSRQVLAVPLAIISTSISQVLLQKLIDHKNNNLPIKAELLKLLSGLLIMTIVGVAAFYLIGVKSFEVIFGSQWKEAALFTELLIISYGVKFIVSTLSITLTALERLKELAMWQIGYCALIISLAFLPDISIYQFFKIYIGVEVLSYLLYYFIIFKAVNKYESQLIG